MNLLSYYLSVHLKDSLEKINDLRAKILTIPITPQMEIGMRYEANIDRIYWFWTLTNKSLSRDLITKKLFLTSYGKADLLTQQITDFKKTMDWIYWEWLASEEIISPKTILQLYNIACSKSDSNKLDREQTVNKTSHFLDYLQKGGEHPVIQAAIAYLQILHNDIFKDCNEKISHLLAYLFLFKNCYDFRRLLVFEQGIKHDLSSYKDILQATVDNNNLNLWLEYFVDAVLYSVEILQNKLTSSHYLLLPRSISSLNDRQKAILNLLEKPGETIVNRKVQKYFNVSQITASRDLSKLVNLGVITIHGEGRSIYYSKA